MPNRLAGETSPYLQQHASNPVDWYPWGEEALGRARRENKPILLSIGYSACHWCHVMAHESFEDEGVAGADERPVRQRQGRSGRAAGSGPDLPDRACDALAKGRRLAVDDVPDAAGRAFFSAAPIFRGTSRYGLTGFADLLPQLARAYREQEKRSPSRTSSSRLHSR
jgi:uncharacterized protein YyaL (SSP411 family)